MSSLTQLRTAAREIFDEALRAVDAGEAVRRTAYLKPPDFCIGNFVTRRRPIYAVALGKAAFAMGYALQQALGDLLVEGVLAGPRIDVSADQTQWPLRSRWRWYAGGHPLPNKRSLYAADHTFDLLERADKKRALVVFLVSGGGSATMEWPINGEITLGDIRAANKILIATGASISEINAVRRAFSAVKGGRLGAHAPDCEQITLIVSDVPKGEEYNVASGPSLRPPIDAPSASEVVEHYGLNELLPASIIHAIEADTASRVPLPNPHPHFVLLDNDTAVEAAADAARGRGFIVELAREISDDPIEVGCEKLMRRVAGIQESNPGKACLISGGEFACPVRGDGIGGRNLETALRLVIAADENRERRGEFVALCAGTDGIDGNSPFAGAIVDRTTIKRARKIGLDPNDFLSRSDAGTFFKALGDSIETGPTGTNVRDLRILLS